MELNYYIVPDVRWLMILKDEKWIELEDNIFKIFLNFGGDSSLVENWELVDIADKLAELIERRR